MTKRVSEEIESFKYSGEPVRLTFGTLALICLCLILIVISTFTQFQILNVFALSKGEISEGFLLSDYLVNSGYYNYIPQLPAIFFTVALLDRRYGMSVIILYILLGLFVFPVFGMGGGIDYIIEYGFGYILAYIPAAFIAATILKNNYKFWNVLKGVVLGVLAIHLIGVMYMLFISTLFNAPMDMITGWVSSQSGIKIIYDIFFSLCAIYFANLLKKGLWLIMC